MTTLQQYSDAGKFMNEMVNRLAERRPDLKDGSGKAFWPVSLYFPQFLANTLKYTQDEIVNNYLAGRVEEARLLTSARMGLMRITYEGDLGEDHTKLFTNDHPQVLRLSPKKIESLPFYKFCQGIVSETNPYVLLGMLVRNEIGSIGELEALMANGFVTPGPFSRAHEVEEVEHGRISEGILNSFGNHPGFLSGFEKHDGLYSSILN